VENYFSEEFFQDDADRHKIPKDSEAEADEEGADSFHYTGNTIDLKEALRQLFLASLPFSPVCSEDCKGLCDSCGADLNRSECRCSK
jgi:uncharacterized protein